MGPISFVGVLRFTFYVPVVRALAQSYRRSASESSVGLPLVINTHGWVKGLGYQLLLAVLDAVHPAHIIQIVSRNEKKQFVLPLQSTQRLHQVRFFIRFKWPLLIGFADSIYRFLRGLGRARRRVATHSVAPPICARCGRWLTSWETTSLSSRPRGGTIR